MFPIAASLVPDVAEEARAFCRTLGKALVSGAQEVLEIEADEIAYFQHPDGAGGWNLVFYETAPGGAGYLGQLARDLGLWAKAAQDRLYAHDCERACYRCLKSARNQFDHPLLDKELVRSALFQLSYVEPTSSPRTGGVGDRRDLSVSWIEKERVASSQEPTSNTPIESALLAVIRCAARLPEPVAQHRVLTDSGELLTVPDFAYPDRRIAVYCDGFAYHGNKEALESDARKRNTLQSQGWAVLTFWGRQILRNPQSCEEMIWQCIQHRRTST